MTSLSQHTTKELPFWSHNCYKCTQRYSFTSSCKASKLQPFALLLMRASFTHIGRELYLLAIQLKLLGWPLSISFKTRHWNSILIRPLSRGVLLLGHYFCTYPITYSEKLPFWFAMGCYKCTRRYRSQACKASKLLSFRLTEGYLLSRFPWGTHLYN